MAPSFALNTIPTTPTSPDQKYYDVRPFVYVVAFTSALSGLVFGYDIGGSGGTFEMAGFRNFFDWPALGDTTDPQWVADEEGWITSMFSLGCIFGSIPSGAFADRFGRKKSIIFLSLLFTVGAIMQLLPPTLAILKTGRFLSGVGVGGLSMAATLYQAETAPSQVRGLVISIQQLSITAGILLASGLNVALQHWEEGWRISYGGHAVFSILLIFLMLGLPESPRWLVAQDKIDEARTALNLLRHEEEVEAELRAIVEAVEAEKLLDSGSWVDLFSDKERMRYRTALGFAIQFLQQFTGINAVMYFAPTIFKKFMGPSMAIVANMAISTANFLGTFIALYSVDRLGRRALLIYGGLGMAFFTGLFALFTSSAFHYETDKTLAGVITACVALYVCNFAYSWGPLAWVIPAEIYPQRLRGKGMTLSTFANWITNFIIAKTVPLFILPQNLNLWGTFLFFSLFCFFMTGFVLLALPETKGVPLEKMEELFDQWIKHTHIKQKLTLKGQKPNDLSISPRGDRHVEIAAGLL